MAEMTPEWAHFVGKAFKSANHGPAWLIVELVNAYLAEHEARASEAAGYQQAIREMAEAHGVERDLRVKAEREHDEACAEVARLRDAVRLLQSQLAEGIRVNEAGESVLVWTEEELRQARRKAEEMMRFFADCGSEVPDVD